jgi:AcrR family transcriptional regulator
MSQPANKRVRRSPEEARTAILDAAEPIVVEVGPAGLRVAAVAKRAGMAHPNILHHFGSREGLLRALAARVFERATARVSEAIAPSFASPPEDRIGALAAVLDAVYRDTQGRLVAWLVLSDLLDEGDIPEFEPLVDIAHQWRVHNFGPKDPVDTRRVILLGASAMLGHAIIGEGVAKGLGLPDEILSREVVGGA